MTTEPVELEEEEEEEGDPGPPCYRCMKTGRNNNSFSLGGVVLEGEISGVLCTACGKLVLDTLRGNRQR